MQQSLAHSRDDRLNTVELGKLKARDRVSNTHPGVTAEQYVQGFTRFFYARGLSDTPRHECRGVAAMLSKFGVEGEARPISSPRHTANLKTNAQDDRRLS